jgi:hypothetical protein
MENNKTLYVVQLQYLGEPSIVLDEQIESQAAEFDIEPGCMSWDEITFVRDIEYLTPFSKDAKAFVEWVETRYSGLCHHHIDTRYN